MLTLKCEKGEHLETFVDKFLILMSEVGYSNREIIVWLKAHNGDVEKFCGNNTAWGSWMSASNPYCRSFTEFILVAHKVEAKIQHEGKSDITKAEFLKFTRSYWVMPYRYKSRSPCSLSGRISISLHQTVQLCWRYYTGPILRFWYYYACGPSDET